MSDANSTRSPRLPRSPRADRQQGRTRTGSGAARRRGYSELGLCALLLAVGVLVLGDALTMDTVASARGPVGPRTVPLVVGTALLVVSVVLTVDVLRGATEDTTAGGGATTLPEPGDAEAETPHPEPGCEAAAVPEQGSEAAAVPGQGSPRTAQPDAEDRKDGKDAAGAVDAEEDEPDDWRTVALLAGVFLAFAALIEPLGFPLAGALLFWGSAFTLGSRRHALTRDPLIAAGLSLLTYTVFHLLLGVHLPGGPLMGVM
ncbi:tripartite tricarboxylate transporter TctB family protein [Streptomyces sp. NPDC006990]|uniref:tripartite tricarboxylate transporter TctB family protein n=1 Tax=unclassified Streptomyces TaxID=2593676 RepID=UPI003454E327